MAMRLTIEDDVGNVWAITDEDTPAEAFPLPEQKLAYLFTEAAWKVTNNRLNCGGTEESRIYRTLEVFAMAVYEAVCRHESEKSKANREYEGFQLTDGMKIRLQNYLTLMAENAANSIVLQQRG
jgi:hypothetical protein